MTLPGAGLGDRLSANAKTSELLNSAEHDEEKTPSRPHRVSPGVSLEYPKSEIFNEYSILGDQFNCLCSHQVLKTAYRKVGRFFMPRKNHPPVARGFIPDGCKAAPLHPAAP